MYHEETTMFNVITGATRLALAGAAALAAAAVVALGAACIERASAAPAVTTFAVTNTNDSGPGSLRQATADANTAPGADTIHITASGTIHLMSTLHITDEVTILGPGADRLAVDGGGSVGVFYIGYVV